MIRKLFRWFRGDDLNHYRKPEPPGISIRQLRTGRTGETTTSVDSDGVVWFERSVNGRMTRVRRDEFMAEQERTYNKLLGDLYGR